VVTCDPHTYDKTGNYRILVKVIEFFGNDTSQVFDVAVTQIREVAVAAGRKRCS
jgi:hypothetical protein